MISERLASGGASDTPARAAATSAMRTREQGSRSVGMLALSVVACLVPIIAMAVQGWHHRWFSDDGWINIRVVEQVLAGNGPVYNAGERVEVTTSTLWFWILLLGAVFPGAPAPEVTGAAVSLLLTLGGMIFASLGAAQLFRARGPIAYAPVGMLVVAALPPMWDFATSGLETGLTFGWLGLCFWMLARRVVTWEKGGRPAAWWPIAPAFVIGLGPLIRPDFALYTAFFAIALLMSSRFRVLDWLWCLLIAIAVPLGYQIFRMGYFAALVPNTALAKSASSSYWERGLDYLLDYVGVYLLMAPLVVVAIVAVSHLVRIDHNRARWAVVAAPILAALLHALYVVRVGGDFMHARFLLPDTFALVLPAAVVGITLGRRQLALAAVAFMAGWGVVVANSVRISYAGGISESGLSDEHGWWASQAQSQQILTREQWVLSPQAQAGIRARQDLEAGLSYLETYGARQDTIDGEGIYLARTNLGIISVMAGLGVNVIDMYALSDPVTARAVMDPDVVGDARVGHLTRPAEWRTARYVRVEPDEPQKVKDARRALQCGDLALLQEAISDEMTPSRFLTNVGLAPRLTFFTFPADAAAARAQLCG